MLVARSHRFLPNYGEISTPVESGPTEHMTRLDGPLLHDGFMCWLGIGPHTPASVPLGEMIVTWLR